MKKCIRCGLKLSLDNFVKNKNKPDGHHVVCKPCTKIYKANYYKENKEKILRQFKERYAENPEKYRELERCRRNEDPELYKKRALGYQKANKDKVNTRHRRWESEQRKSNEQYKMRAFIRQNLNNALKRDSVNCIAVQHLGCSISFYKDYLSKQFKGDMSWENRGVVWSVDHISPLSAFDLTDSGQLEKACHYTNTQPLYIVENNKKGGANRGT